MNILWLPKLGLRHPNIKPLAILLIVYFICRLAFQQLPMLKAVFIIPTGWMVQIFYGAGHLVNGEWLFNVQQTLFVLGESCSGTTFFSLLVAYISFRITTQGTSAVWLLLAYPMVLVANAMRVLSSMVTHNVLQQAGIENFSDQIHVATGTITFLCSFLCINNVIERSQRGLKSDH